MLSQKSPSTTLSRQDNSAFTLTRNPAKTRTWQEVLEVFKAVFAEVYEVTIRIEAANNEEPFFDELDF